MPKQIAQMVSEKEIPFKIREIISAFQNGIDVVDNLNVRSVVASTAALAANTPFTVDHRLGRIPRGFIVVGIRIAAGATSAVPGIVYFTDTDEAAWTAEQVTLRYTVNKNLHEIRLILF